MHVAILQSSRLERYDPLLVCSHCQRRLSDEVSRVLGRRKSRLVRGIVGMQDDSCYISALTGHKQHTTGFEVLRAS